MSQCEQASRSTNPDVIQAALHYLMTRYHQKPGRGLALAVVHHLEMLVDHPEFSPNEVGNDVYAKLLQTWTTIASEPRIQEVLVH